MKIQLRRKDMNSDSQPRRSTETDIEAGGSLIDVPGAVGAECVDENMVVRISAGAGWVEGLQDGLVSVQHEGDLGAGVGYEVLFWAEGHEDFVCCDADDAHGYDEAAL